MLTIPPNVDPTANTLQAVWPTTDLPKWSNWLSTEPIPQPYGIRFEPTQRDTSMTIAFDLDDTLLLNSCVSPTSFTDDSALLFPAWKANSPAAWTQCMRSWRGQRFWSRLRKTSNFLKESDLPLTHVCFRPGALQLLARLRNAGARLILVTASSQIRLAYLFKRMPWFLSFFNNDGEKAAVISGEMLEMATTAMQQHEDNPLASEITPWHFNGPASLAMKSQAVIQYCLGIRHGYDLLVDDNEETASLFASHGRSKFLLKVDGKSPTRSTVVPTIAAEIAERMGIPRLLEEDWSTKSLPEFVLEDPFYMPYLRRSLTVESN